MTKEKIATNLTQGSIDSHLLNLSQPLIYSYFLTRALDVVESLFLSWYGSDALKAFAFALPLIGIGRVVAGSFSYGVTLVVGREWGRQRYRKAIIAGGYGAALALMVTILFSITSVLFLKTLLHKLGVPEALGPLAYRYMVVWYIAVTFLALQMAISGAFRGIGNTHIQSQAMYIHSILTIVTTPLLVFGWFGFPQMGIMGAAVGMLIGWGTSALYTVVQLVQQYRQIIESFPTVEEGERKLRNILEIWKEIVRVTLPTAAKGGLFPILQAYITAVFSAYSANLVAAFALLMRLEPLFLCVIAGLKGAVIPLTVQNLVANKKERVIAIVRNSLQYSLVYGLSIGMLVFLFASQIVHLVTDDPLLAEKSIFFMRKYCITFGFYGMQMLGGSLFIGLGMSSKPFTLSVLQAICVLLLMPIGIGAASEPGAIYGIVLAQVFTGTLTCVWVMTSARQAIIENTGSNN